MKIKKGFIIRKLGTEHMVVAIGQASKEFSGMIKLNDTSALLWNALVDEATEDELVALIVNTYEDVTEEEAKADVKEFLDTISIAVE